MRKYSRLKEAYYETEFIGDDDSKAGFDVDIPSDFPDWAPEGAYQAFINCYYDGDESQWNADVFSKVYEGEWDTIEDFVEHYFEDIDTDEYWKNLENKQGINVFENDSFYDCVDYRSLGQSVKEWYEDDIHNYKINKELPKDKEKGFYVKYLSIHNNGLSKIATVYIRAVAEREGLSYREAVHWIDKNKKKILHWDWGIPMINDLYYHLNNFYFDRYY